MRSCYCFAILSVAGMLLSPVTTFAAEPDDDIWDLLGSGVVSQSSLLIMVSPRIETRSDDSKASSGLSKYDGGLILIGLDPEDIYIHTGEGRWMRVSEREFWALVIQLEEAGYDFTVETDPEMIIGLIVLAR